MIVWARNNPRRIIANRKGMLFMGLVRSAFDSRSVSWLRWVFAYATKEGSSEIHIWLVEASEVELHAKSRA